MVRDGWIVVGAASLPLILFVLARLIVGHSYKLFFLEAAMLQMLC